MWMLTRYRDVHAVLRDPRFSVERMRAPLMRDNLDRMPEFLRQSAQGLRSMLIMDPPDHTRVRKLVNKAFTPKRIAALRGHIEAIVARARSTRRGRRARFDLIHDLAEPLPGDRDRRAARRPGRGPPPVPRVVERADRGLRVAERRGARDRHRRRRGSLFDYLADTIAARRRAPREDLISAMIAGPGGARRAHRRRAARDRATCCCSPATRRRRT